MGILIGAEHLSQEWPGKQVLLNQTIGVNEGEHIGIVGTNGDGKTTLLELLSHNLEPDSGEVIWRGGITVGLLAQSDDLNEQDTVLHAVMGDVPEYVWASDVRKRSILDELLRDVDLSTPVGKLSGGQRRRCDLARVLCGSWDVLMMDEPTNHLDMHAITWLANHLKHRWPDGEGALLVVTHDRWFLDEVCEHMWEVHDGRIEPFEGGYSAYIQQRVERQRQAEVKEERRQNALRKELNWLSHGAKARTSKPRFRVEAARALIAEDPPLRNTVELRRMAVSRLGKQVIEMKNVSVGYGGPAPDVLHDINWIIGPGDRIGILGENGVGKSSLLKTMCGRLQPTSGRVKIGASVRFGILSQDLVQLKDRDDSRVEELLSTFKSSYVVDGRPQSPSQLLERLGFTRREFPTPIKDLSGGQKRRLALLCVLMEEPNVLVLDEPGNDLDTDMLAVLEDLLDSWPGTLLLVTHDRFLMERVTDDQFAIIDRSIRHVPGGVDEYLKLLDKAALQKADESSRFGSREVAAVAAQKSSDPPEQTNQGSLSNAERVELKRRYDSISRRLKRYEGEPDRLRAKLGELDPSDYEALMAAQEKVEEAEKQLSDLETEWIELSDRLGLD